MKNIPVVLPVLHGHSPFVRHPETVSPPEERWFFESLSETYIPLLEVFDRLDRDMVPFRMGLSLSPSLCHMLTDEMLITRYLEHTNSQIEFGERELKRTAVEPELKFLAEYYLDTITRKRTFFLERCERNILKRFDYYQKKGRLEILATSATHAFLPFYTAYPEAVQAQFEVAISTYRGNFGKYPQGFWLPEMGWTEELDIWLRSYNFNYTLLDSHALPFARPSAEKGNFYPARTPQGAIVFGRDFYAAREIAEGIRNPAFRFNRRDRGFELPLDDVRSFLGPWDSRAVTGYKYWASGEDGMGRGVYNPKTAAEKAKENARLFFDRLFERLWAASALMEDRAVSLCAFEADDFGRFWYEGPTFIEAFFRNGMKRGVLQFMTPVEYLSKQNPGSFQTLVPEFSSWGNNGYAETWLDASNDWIYSHATRALERMVEIAERFPDNTGLKERALNQAAREILLVLSSDWSRMLSGQEHAGYARSRIEGSLRNFTTIYEALGSNHISTEWLTQLEKRHNIFPKINYRVFRRKK